MGFITVNLIEQLMHFKTLSALVPPWYDASLMPLLILLVRAERT